MQWLWIWLLTLFFGGNKVQLNPEGELVAPTITISQITSTLVPTKKITVVSKTPAGEWGVAKQIGPVTWTMKIGEDLKMATPKEILAALNVYRVKRGSQELTWNENLAKFAQTRADYLASIKTTDAHKGFEDYLNNQDGFNKLGFTWLGENISYGYRMEGVHFLTSAFQCPKISL